MALDLEEAGNRLTGLPVVEACKNPIIIRCCHFHLCSSAIIKKRINIYTGAA
jgi:hypothetical protein